MDSSKDRKPSINIAFYGSSWTGKSLTLGKLLHHNDVIKVSDLERMEKAVQDFVRTSKMARDLYY
jgi:translation elongation factor EF-1alpha